MWKAKIVIVAILWQRNEIKEKLSFIYDTYMTIKTITYNNYLRNQKCGMYNSSLLKFIWFFVRNQNLTYNGMDINI